MCVVGRAGRRDTRNERCVGAESVSVARGDWVGERSVVWIAFEAADNTGIAHGVILRGAERQADP